MNMYHLSMETLCWRKGAVCLDKERKRDDEENKERKSISLILFTMGMMEKGARSLGSYKQISHDVSDYPW